MSPNTERDDPRVDDDDTIREGNLTVEERMNRRDGLVEYEGTVGDERAGGEASAADDNVVTERSTSESGTTPAMQAGATILAGTGSTAMVDDAASGSTAATSSMSSTASSDLDMATDNTVTGQGCTADSGPISMAREGMEVVDSTGDRIGTVDSIKQGDPQAATTAGQTTGASEPFGDVGDVVFGAGDGPDLDEPLRGELLRGGYLKIDGTGWFGSDRYVRADQIADVSGETVTLSVAKDETIEA